MTDEMNFSIEKCIERLNDMAGKTERALAGSLKSLMERDAALGHDVIDADKAINACEIALDTMTYTILAMKRLPAETLRHILAIQKITVMLERIGDHAVNIAESGVSLNDAFHEHALFDIPKMALVAQAMFTDAVTSFKEQNMALANTVFAKEAEADTLNAAITNEIKFNTLKGSTTFETAIELIRVCKNLERIADLSTNIAEETCFFISGRIVKHQEHAKPLIAEILAERTPAYS